MTATNALSPAPASLVSPRKAVADKLSKLSFDQEEKENSNTANDVPLMMKKEESPEREAVVVAKSAEEKPRQDQEDEPILRHNPRRFVLFPIQFNNVRVCFAFFLFLNNIF